MNVRNSIFNKVSKAVGVLQEMKDKRIISNESVEIEISVPETLDIDNSVTAKFKVMCDLHR